MPVRIYCVFNNSFRYDAAPCISHETIDGVKTLCGRKVADAATLEPDSNDLDPDCNICRRIAHTKKATMAKNKPASDITSADCKPLNEWLAKHHARFLWRCSDSVAPTIEGWAIGANVVLAVLYTPKPGEPVGWDLCMPASTSNDIAKSLEDADAMIAARNAG